MTRIKNTIKNTSVGIIAQVVTILINFINRTIFIRFLGVEYLGISGLLSNILSMLSLAELGIGVAIVFNLYKPLLDNNRKKIKALMHFYQQAYRIIGIVVLILGLCLIPFLDVIIKEQPDVPYFNVIYVLFLLNTVVSYFFAYKRSIFSADQKEYQNTMNRTFFSIIQSVLQFLVLLIFKNYLLYLCVVIICTLASNIHISIVCDKQYPYLKNNKEQLDKFEKRSLMKYVFAQMSHKVGGVVVSGTDNILISAFVTNGLTVVGLYSNYLLLINAIRSMLNIVFNSVMASVGNLNAEDNSQKSKAVFDKMFFLNMCFFGITSCCFWNLLDDFITLWIGESYLLQREVMLVIVVNYYITGMRQSCITFNTTLGLFWNDRFKPWIESLINLIGSLILIKYFGFLGVLLGTLVSTLLTSFWVEPVILYKHGFRKNVLDYFKKYFTYAVVILLASLVAWFIGKFIIVSNWILWIFKGIITFGTCLIIVIIFLGRTKECRELINMARMVIRKIGK